MAGSGDSSTETPCIITGDLVDWWLAILNASTVGIQQLNFAVIAY
jgi:hypothetical protein